jgi:hypothetical protein
MNAARAQEYLQRAEALDGYRRACQASEVNRKARENCQYHAWHDQSSVPTVEGATVIFLPPSADGGMPHTRAGNLICIPVYFPESRLQETLRHELVHIDQRNRPLVWRQRLLEEGWSPVDAEEIPRAWADRCRLNPDTIHSRFWAWEGRYVPLPVFVREDKPELKDVDIRWFDRIEQRVGTQIPSSFTAKYGSKGTAAMEHPFELYAYHSS